MEMAEIKQYVDILLESLERKKNILQIIQKENIKQEEAIKKNSDLAAFDHIVENKSRFIAELELLDSGFEKVYDRVKEELPLAKDSFRNEIARMQQLISEITCRPAVVGPEKMRLPHLRQNGFGRSFFPAVFFPGFWIISTCTF